MSQVKKKLSLLKICMVSSVAVAINIGFSVIASYGLPLVLATGLGIKYATLIFSISSVLSFLLQGLLGTTSDHCTCIWGRRRPFIVAFSTLTAIGLVLASFAFYLNVIPSDSSMIIVAMCVCIGIIICDFSVGVLQLPSRAYLLDVTSTSQAEIANFIYSALFGVGTILGTLLGAMKWSLLTHQPVTIPHQAQIVYTIASFIIIVCTIVTVCSVKEQQFKEVSQQQLLVKEDNNIEEESDCSINDEDYDKLIENNHEDEQYNNVEDDPNKPDQNHYTDQDSDHTNQSLALQGNDTADIRQHNDEQEIVNNAMELSTNNKKHFKAVCIDRSKKIFNPFLDIFIFLPKMSHHMWLVWIMAFFSMQGLAIFNGYVTLYVGTVVYDGDPHANHSTESYQQYATGVHTGTWALFLSAITNTVASLTLNIIIKFISLKTVFLISTALYCVGACFLIYFHELLLVFAVGAIYGVYFGLTLTVPYVLIPIYKEHKLMFRKGKSINGEAVEGRACAVINTSVFLSLLILSFITGPLLDLAQDNSYIMLFACISSSLTFFSALVVRMPETQKIKKNEEEVIEMNTRIIVIPKDEDSVDELDQFENYEDTSFTDDI